jgi:limonene-1,2-epoxide hydrolase
MAKYLVLICAFLVTSLIDRPALAADAAQMEQNKKTVMALYDAALNKKDFDEASKYLGPRYTQHNPSAKDGPEGLKGFIAFLKEKFPQSRSEIKKIFADGDYVISTRCASPARAGLRFSTCSSSKTARWSSTGTRCSRSRRPRRTTTRCSETL